MHIPSSLCSLPVRRLCNRISYIVGSRVGFSRCSSRFLRVFVASDCLVSVESFVSCFLSVVAGVEGICINKNYCIPIAWCPSYEFRATHYYYALRLTGRLVHSHHTIQYLTQHSLPVLFKFIFTPKYFCALRALASFFRSCQ